jgi:glutamate synthase domain-containing protein 2
MKPNPHWSGRSLTEIYKQAETGGVLLSGMGTDRPHASYWDRILLDASQVTNPSIDPLREPMELKTFLGRKPDRIDKNTKIGPQLELEVPVLFSAMSYGAISYNVCSALAEASKRAGTFWNTGEGGLPKSLHKYGGNTIVQVASGRFGVHKEYLDVAAAVEIKIGQGAKPGIGGHLPGEKVSAAISETRMIPIGTDALSPAPHHDIYSIEDLEQLITCLKEATRYKKPIIVKIAAVHNSAAIASGIVRAGADIIALDGIRGGTGAAPTRIRDNVGIPIELALASVDERLRREGIRNHASIIAAGGIRNSADAVKAIALGADAVYIATAALAAVGCHLCQKCYTGKCNWGIATQDPYLVRRVNPDIAAERLYNLLRAWSYEIKEMLGGMGINAVESLRGNRLRLRGIGLNEVELKLLGIKPAGESM